MALLFITVASFGLLIPWLGFYWDDWPVIYLTHTQGTNGFASFYQYDRPLSAWTYILFAPLLGTTPLPWHIFTLLLRWLTALFLWASLRQIWPEKPRQVLWVAVLFAVSPIFTQQPVAVAYSQHWLSYLLFFGSIYLMLRALAERRNFYLLTVLALIASLVQMLTMEYFVGLELLRPVILWLYLQQRQSQAPVRQVLRDVLASGWIYALLVVLYIIWRMFFLRLPEADPNRPVFLESLASMPLEALIGLTQKALQDFVYLLSAWLVALRPAEINLQRPFSLAALAIALAASVIFWMVMSRYEPASQESGDERWHTHALILGVLAILLGTLPVWMIDRQVSVGPLGNRFSLAALFGVSLFFVGFLDWLSPRRQAKLTVICLLIGVAIHANLHTAKAYQQSWEKQRAFYWQLYWRAPYVQPGTAFISNEEIFSYVGLYSTSMGISLLYPPVEQPENMPYWFFVYWERLYRFPDQLLEGTLLEEELRNHSFRGRSTDSLLLDFSPELNRCLHLLSIEDEADRDLPESMRRLLSISNLSRISRESPGQWKPPASIFGQEPEPNWCYYFEKAELAYQYGEWEEVVRLMHDAKEQGFTPTEMKEYLPLLDAYLKIGQIEAARTLALQMVRLSNNIDDRVCEAWLDVSEIHTNTEFDSAFKEIRDRSNCFD